MAVSFTQSVKKEILAGLKGAPPCCEFAFLTGLIRTAGSVSLSNSGMGFAIAAENLDALKRADVIVRKQFGIETELIEEKSVGRSRVRYALRASSGEKVLTDCGIVVLDEQGLRQISSGFDNYLIEEECCAKQFVKAVFLGAGYVTLPEETNKDGYHLEFALTSEELEQPFTTVLQTFGFNPKKVLRKEEIVLYFKGSDEIGDLLSFLGATKSMFRLQNTVAQRSLRNRANRQTNCISANIDKTVNAAEKQLIAIRAIEETVGLQSLPLNLRQAAELRKENPSESLDELAALSGMSKSGLNHRFRKILDIASQSKK